MSGVAVTDDRDPRRWVGLAVIALPCLLYSMDLTVLELAIPTLSADLRPTSTQLLWIMDIYGFLIAGLLLTMGTLGDRIGRRRLLLLGAASFGAASLLAAFATSAELLIGARALLGVAGAMLAPSTLSLIRTMFPDARERTTAIAVWATSFSVGAALGPLAGGVLLEHFWWGSVFLLALPVMAVLLVLGPVLLPEYRDPGADRLDLPSALLSLVAVLAVISGLKEIAQGGVDTASLAALMLGGVSSVAFARRQQRLVDPLIDLRLFRVPTFSTSLGAFAFSLFAIAGIFLFVAQHLQLVLGLSPLQAGLWTLPSALGLVAGSLLAPALVRSWRPATVIAGGLVVSGAGTVLLTQATMDQGLAVVVVASTILTLGAAPIGTVATDLVVGSVPAARAGAASGISETGAELGGALGIAVLGSIGTAAYRTEIAGAMPPAVPPHAAQIAEDTLGGALDVAAQLPVGVATPLVAAAREAFVAGMAIVSITAAGMALTLAVATIVLFRGSRDDRPADAAVGTRPNDRATP